VNAAAREAVQTRFTALLHHVDVEALERAFWRQKPKASAGVDGITVEDYERNLENDLRDLCARIYRTLPTTSGPARVHSEPMTAGGLSVCPSWKTRSSRARSPRR
jgi:hypothetical protein